MELGYRWGYRRHQRPEAYGTFAVRRGRDASGPPPSPLPAPDLRSLKYGLKRTTLVAKLRRRKGLDDTEGDDDEREATE